MTDFPILRRTRADLARQLAGLHRNDPRRRQVERALADATNRLMRSQLRAARHTSSPPLAAADDLFALLSRGPAAPSQEIRA